MQEQQEQPAAEVQVEPIVLKVTRIGFDTARLLERATRDEVRESLRQGRPARPVRIEVELDNASLVAIAAAQQRNAARAQKQTADVLAAKRTQRAERRTQQEQHIAEKAARAAAK